MNHSRWHRFLIAIAGPTMNILLAIVLLTTVYMVHYEYPAVYDKAPVIGWVCEGYAGGQGWVQVGDRITRIDGVENPTWEQVDLKQALSPGQPLMVDTIADGQTLEKTVVPEAMGTRSDRIRGLGAERRAGHHHRSASGMPAEKAGLKEGDKNLALDGKPVPALASMVESLEVYEGQADHAHRAAEWRAEDAFTLQPVLSEKRYRIGIGNMQMKVKTLPFARP